MTQAPRTGRSRVGTLIMIGGVALLLTAGVGFLVTPGCATPMEAPAFWREPAPVKGLVEVGGLVARAGWAPVGPNTPLTPAQAIEHVGGVSDPEARRVTIVRERDGTFTSFTLELSSPAIGGEGSPPRGGPVLLHAGDVVSVAR